MSFNSAVSAVGRVRAWRVAKGWTIHKFAGLADVSEATLRGIDGDDWNPTFRTMLKLEALIPAGWQAGDPVPAEAATEAAA